jgi:hypothetical protein
MPTGSQGPQQTNDLGEFRIAGLAAGEYVVAASRGSQLALPIGGLVSSTRQGARTTIATTYYPGTTDQNGASPIVVGAGVEIGNITFTAQSVPAHYVSGVVVDENGAPLAGAMVTLMVDPRTGGVPIGPAGSARTAADGSFSIGDVPAGSYRLNASVPIVWNNSGSAGGIVSSTSVLRPGVPQQTEVVVTDADVSGLQIVVRQPRR